MVEPTATEPAVAAIWAIMPGPEEPVAAAAAAGGAGAWAALEPYPP